MSVGASSTTRLAHSVRFYLDDGVLLHELQGHVGKALAGGSSALIITTAGHHSRLRRDLKKHDVDFDRAVAEGRYIALDAGETLSKFMVHGHADPELFFEVLGAQLSSAIAASLDKSRSVFAFGEMVALLWAEGKFEAALELERLWNGLGKNYSFSLHCAYPLQSFQAKGMDELLLKICAEHTEAVGGDYYFDPPSTLPKEVRLQGNRVSYPFGGDPFHLFVDAVRDYAIFMLDPAGRVTTWNTGAERIKGYEASEIIGQHFSRFYPEEDIHSGKPDELLRVATANGWIEDEGWRVRKDGSKFWADVVLTAVRDKSGALVGFGKVTRDLSERRRSELSLRRSEERSRLFTEAVQDYAIFMLDPEGYVSTWNLGAARIKGYQPVEIIGQHFSRFYLPEDLESGKPKRELELAASQGRLEDEGWRVRKDGSKFWANVIITAVRDDAGKLMGFSKVTRDVTDRMLAGKSLEESRRKLQESERSLRELSHHLLRTQDEERRSIGREMHDSLGQFLSVLKMRLDAMSAPRATAPVTKQALQECAMLAAECVKEVRTVSYLLYPPMLEELGLGSAIPWYVEGFSKRSGIETSSEIPADFPRLGRDVELVLFRVLQESLTNVHKHSGSHTAAIRLLCSEGSVILEVSDSGNGFSSAIVDGGRQDWTGSLGVGLRGMSERLQQLGGRLQLCTGTAGTRVQAVVPLKSSTVGNTLAP